VALPEEQGSCRLNTVGSFRGLAVLFRGMKRTLLGGA
jgi:hypothetical protein